MRDMKRGLLVVGLVVALVGAWEGIRRIVPSTIEYQGEDVRLTKLYLDYDSYKNDPHNIHPDELGRVEKLVSTGSVPDRYSSWEDAASAVLDLSFPGYGSGSLGSEWEVLRCFTIEIPHADSERVFLFRHEGNDTWTLVADFIAPSSIVVSHVQERDGRFVFSNSKGEQIFEWPE